MADTLSPLEWMEAHGMWSTHPDYSIDDWQLEVADKDTVLGYWDWAQHKWEEPDDG